MIVCFISSLGMFISNNYLYKVLETIFDNPIKDKSFNITFFLTSFGGFNSGSIKSLNFILE